jgi:WhiB family transcriptional regulator, redox-sensing transcriptional regulator
VDFLAALTRGMPWERRAACRDSFDPTTNRGTWIVEPSAELNTPASVADKLEICDRCTVRAECLRYALDAQFETFGIWGGSTGIERTTLAPRSIASSTFGYGDARREQIERAEQILTAAHDERLERWRGFAREAAGARARGESRSFRLTRRRVTGPLREALRS